MQVHAYEVTLLVFTVECVCGFALLLGTHSLEFGYNKEDTDWERDSITLEMEQDCLID